MQTIFVIICRAKLTSLLEIVKHKVIYNFTA